MVVRIESRIEGPITVVTIAGRLEGSGVRELHKLCGPAKTGLALDLSGLDSADDAALDALRKLVNQGAELRGVSPFIQLLLASDPAREVHHLRSGRTGALHEPVMTLPWKVLSGQERYRIVELARKGQVAISELCKTFGVSRQTLYRAMAAVDRASAEALEPKKRGRKPRPESAVRTTELASINAELQKQLKHWKTEYRAVRTLLDLERKLERGEALPGEPGKKRKRRKAGQTAKRRSSTNVSAEDSPEG